MTGEFIYIPEAVIERGGLHYREVFFGHLVQGPVESFFSFLRPTLSSKRS